MSNRLALVPVLLAVAASAACQSSHRDLSTEERAVTVVEAATHISYLNQYFLGATNLADVEVAIRADMSDPTCLTIDAQVDTLQVTFDGCVSRHGAHAFDGTIVATLTVDGQFALGVDVTGEGLIAGQLEIDGSWTVDLSAAVDLSASWTGDLNVAGFGGSVDAHVSASISIVGLCLEISLDADASVLADAGGADVEANASVDISVTGLLLCDGTCPGAGLIEISIDGDASVLWDLVGGGSLLGAIDLSIDLGGLGSECPMGEME